MSFAYATTNALSSRVAGDFTPGSGPSDATRAYLNDGRMDRQYVFTAAASSNTLVIDMGSATTLRGIAILNHNLVDSVAPRYITVEAADDDAITVNPVTAKGSTTVTDDSTDTNPVNKDTVLQFAAVTKRYWRLTFAWDSGSFALKIGELFAYAASTQLSRGQVDGSGETERIIAPTVEMQNGETRSAFIAGPVRIKHLRSDSTFSTSERKELLTLWRLVRGPVTPFLWIESYEATATSALLPEQDCIFGRLMLPDFAWTWSDYNLSQPPEFVLQSLGREVGS
jgi:hypothetical protein